MADIESIITSSIADARAAGTLEPEDSGEVATGEEIVAEETVKSETISETIPKDKPEEKKEPVVEETDKLLEELGFKPRTDGKDNLIPYNKRVKPILANREKKAIDQVAKALGVDASTLKFDGLETAVSERMKQFADFETRSADFDKAENIMLTDADRYIRILAHLEPKGYGKYLQLLDGKVEKTEPVVEEDMFLKVMPEPDMPVTMPDGTESRTYSVKGMRAVFKAAVEEGRKIAKAEAEGIVKPLNEARAKADQDVEDQKKLDDELKEGMTWEGFEEYFADVLKALQDDSKEAARTRAPRKLKRLHDAYIKVVPAKLREKGTVNEQTVRAKILEEMKGATKSTSIDSEGASKAVVSASDDPVTDAIVRSIKHLKR